MKLQLSFTVLLSFCFNLLMSQETLDLSVNNDLAYQENPIDIDITTLPNSDLFYKIEAPPYTCHCLISSKNLTGKKSSDGACLYLDTKHKERFPLNDFKRRRCNERCTDVAKRISQAQKDQLKSCLCKSGTNGVTEIRAYSHIAGNRLMTAHGIGTLRKYAAKTEKICNCSGGAELDRTHNMCKTPLCKTASPTSNRELGDWGFIWDNVIYQWQRPNCVNKTVSPARCEFTTY